MLGAGTGHPLEIVSVDRLPLGGDKVMLQIRGRWQGPSGAGDSATLIAELGAERVEFPAIAQPRRPRLGRPQTWSRSFALPLRLVEAARLTIAVGGYAVPVSEPVSAPQPAPPASREPAPVPPAQPRAAEPVAPPVAVGEEPVAVDVGPAAAPGSTGFDETLERLRRELRERASTEAALRGQLADAHADLRAREINHGHLLEVQVELRAELETLAGLVRRHEEEMRRLLAELGASEAAREAAASEAAGLAAELERLTAELGNVRAERAAEASGLDEAEALLAEARELGARIRADGSSDRG